MQNTNYEGGGDDEKVVEENDDDMDGDDDLPRIDYREFCQSTLINENESHFLLILKSCQRLKMPHIILKWSHFLSGKSPGIDQLKSIVPFYTCHAKILEKRCKAILNNKSTEKV